MNPADPGTMFRKKAETKHIGYVGNIVESVGANGSLVMDYAYEQNIYSQFLKDYISYQPIYDNPVILAAAGAYSGEENVTRVKGHNIAFIPTNFTGYKPADIFAEFKFSEDGQELLELSWKAVNRAKHLRYMKTEEFGHLSHLRNGVEAIPSLLHRKYWIDKILAHGRKRARLHFGFKIAALNFQGTNTNLVL